MPRKSVQCLVHSRATPEKVWSIAREFCAAWHPAIETIEAEYDPQGHMIRVFKVKNEDTVYRERLTWFSDSERSFGYSHLEGISGVDQYDATLSVEAGTTGGSVVTMSADIWATGQRLQQIAEGTEAVFDVGTRALAALAETSDLTASQSMQNLGNGQIKTRTLAGQPALAVSYIDGPSSTLCLFLHGIGGNRSNWNAQLRSLEPACQVAALDLRGYGDSALGSEQSSVDDYCEDILRVAREFEADRLILCGLSYGAWIATSFAMRHADKLAALVLAGGCTGMSEAGYDEREAFRVSREVPLDEGQAPADFALGVVSLISGPTASDEVRQELLISMQAIQPNTYRDALRCFTNPVESFDFSKITMPVLLMTGEYDKLAPPGQINQVAKRIHDLSSTPDVRYECIPAAGHVCNLEMPSAFNKPLLELVSRVT